MKRVFASLARQNLIISCQPEGHASRRKYYRINTEVLNEIADGAKLEPSKGPNWNDGKGPNWNLPITKTTPKTSPKNTKGIFHGKSAVIDFHPKFPYPKTEEEFIHTLEVHGIEPDLDHDGLFFDRMHAKGWTIRRKPIFDWIATYKARLGVTSPMNRRN